MKRLFSYLFLFLVVGIANLATPAQSKGIGKGTLYMSDTAIREFHTYIKLQSGTPHVFLIDMKNYYLIFLLRHPYHLLFIKIIIIIFIFLKTYYI